jgi:hypothetical protein
MLILLLQVLAYIHPIPGYIAAATVHPGETRREQNTSAVTSAFECIRMVIVIALSVFYILTICILTFDAIENSPPFSLLPSLSPLPLSSPQAVRKVSNRDAALRIMRGNRRSPSASMSTSPYAMGVSPTVEEDRANQQTDLAPERYVPYIL